MGNIQREARGAIPYGNSAHWGLDRQSLWPGCLRPLGSAGTTARGAVVFVLVHSQSRIDVCVCAPVHVCGVNTCMNVCTCMCVGLGARVCMCICMYAYMCVCS